jgi:hypothetical protein
VVAAAAGVALLEGLEVRETRVKAALQVLVVLQRWLELVARAVLVAMTLLAVAVAVAVAVVQRDW